VAHRAAREPSDRVQDARTASMSSPRVDGEPSYPKTANSDAKQRRASRSRAGCLSTAAVHGGHAHDEDRRDRLARRRRRAEHGGGGGIAPAPTAAITSIGERRQQRARAAIEPRPGHVQPERAVAGQVRKPSSSVRKMASNTPARRGRAGPSRVRASRHSSHHGGRRPPPWPRRIRRGTLTGQPSWGSRARQDPPKRHPAPEAGIEGAAVQRHRRSRRLTRPRPAQPWLRSAAGRARRPDDQLDVTLRVADLDADLRRA